MNQETSKMGKPSGKMSCLVVASQVFNLVAALVIFILLIVIINGELQSWNGEWCLNKVKKNYFWNGSHATAWHACHALVLSCLWNEGFTQFHTFNQILLLINQTMLQLSLSVSLFNKLPFGASVCTINVEKLKKIFLSKLSKISRKNCKRKCYLLFIYFRERKSSACVLEQGCQRSPYKTCVPQVKMFTINVNSLVNLCLLFPAMTSLLVSIFFQSIKTSKRLEERKCRQWRFIWIRCSSHQEVLWNW